MRKFVCILAICLSVWISAFGRVQAASADPIYFELAQSQSIPSSAPFRIENVYQFPVLTRGSLGSWDSVDLLNPSVIRYKDRFFNYYSGFDGTIWRTGVAVSDDGIHWKKYANNPVLSPSLIDWDVSYISANGAAVPWNGQVLYFYQGVDRTGTTNIGLAISEDGYTFAKLPKPVLTTGPEFTWDSAAIADPYVIVKGGYLYLYYLGQNEKLVQRLGIARSQNGRSWEKLISNPVLDVGAQGTFDEYGLGEPSVVHVHPYFYLIYTGRDADENRNIGYAISTDGVNWKKMSVRGLLSSDQRSKWASHVVCDTTLLAKGNGRFFVWFGGGDHPEAAQNLNGEVGLLSLDLGQNRNLAEFSANSDWKRTPARPTDILYGSYEIEGESNKRLSWIGPRASITLHLGSEQQGKALVVRGWVPGKMIADVTKQSDPITIGLIVNGQILAKTTTSRDENIALSVSWSDLRRHVTLYEGLDLEIVVSRSFVPAEYGINKDKRVLALAISWIGFE